MADPELVLLLRENLPAWNEWRLQSPNTIPFLRDADLRKAALKRAQLGGAELIGANLDAADLSRANLRGANLSEASLIGANLTGADLEGADLTAARLRGAKLKGTRLVGADLVGADLRRAILIEANLSEADLTQACLDGANLSSSELRAADLSRACIGCADFSDARFSSTVLADMDLTEATGLEFALHAGPSSLGLDTFFRSKGVIPEAFLRGVGLPDTFLRYAASLMDKAFEFRACRICYSAKDQSFAKILHTDLQAKNVRCWLAPEHFRTGDLFLPDNDADGGACHKVLLLLSKSSVGADWVQRKAEYLLKMESEQRHLFLLPVGLDKESVDAEAAWLTEVRRTRPMVDFSRWKENTLYRRAFGHLLRELQREPSLPTI
jgi:uncharacterized protein YjbI with pentapeptide repeats